MEPSFLMNKGATMNHKLLFLAGAFAVAGCDQGLHAAHPDAVRVTLAPDVVSSQDGTIHARAVVLASATALANWDVVYTIDYTDRNGIARAVTGTSGLTGRTGTFEATFTGLRWAGSGTVTASVREKNAMPALNRDGGPISSQASFAVLDLSPPVLTIEPPTMDLRVGTGFPFDVQVHATDEIGIGQVIVQVVGELNDTRSQIVASGTTDGVVSFGFDVPNGALPGPTITIYAIAEDLSGNFAAATAVTLTVDPTIVVGVLPGFSARTLTSGTGGGNGILAAPTAIARSPKDGMLYVADAAGGTCGNGCIRKVDASTGAVSATLVVAAQPAITGLSFDATGDNLYYSFNNGGNTALVQLTWNAGTSTYATPVICNVPVNQNPPDPWHSVFDATLGLLVSDQGDKVLKRQAACTQTDPTNFAGAGMFDQPWGVAQKSATDFYVSDFNLDRIFHVTSGGATDTFEISGQDRPQGIEWLAGGPSIFADSLLVANNGSQRLSSTRGNFTSRSAAYFRDPPIDLALTTGTAYVVTVQGGGNPGRIFAISGF